jgi:hypothetical protein
MKVWGYFDASGTHDNLDSQSRPSPSVSVAGYLATPKQWLQFDRDWKAILDGAGVPYFHATEFVARIGVYKGWSEEKRDKFIKDLIQAIYNNVTYGVGMAVLRSDFDRVVAAIPETKYIFGSPYHFCSLMCFATGVDWARESKYDETIKYIFENGDEYKHQVLNAHTKACKDERVREFFRFRAGELTFDDGVKVRPLQAADFLAYELYREMQRKVYPNPKYPYTRNSLMALLRVRGEYKEYREDDLVGYVNDFIEYASKRNEGS